MGTNPYESPKQLEDNKPARRSFELAIAWRGLLLGLFALGIGVVAAFGFLATYPWSADPAVNPFAQALAMLISMTLVGTVTFITISIAGVVYLSAAEAGP